jgi:hypothetical protein
MRIKLTKANYIIKYIISWNIAYTYDVNKWTFYTVEI